MMDIPFLGEFIAVVVTLIVLIIAVVMVKNKG